MTITTYNPEGLGAPMAQYSHVTRVSGGDTLYIAGQIAVGREGQLVGVCDFEAQCEQVFANIGTALSSAGVGFDEVVQFTVYLTSADLIQRFFDWRIRNFPRLFASGRYPPSTLLIVVALARPQFLIEVQPIAVVPGGRGATLAARKPKAAAKTAARRKPVPAAKTRAGAARRPRSPAKRKRR